MDLCQDSQDFSDYSSILSSEKDLTYGVSAGKRDQIEFFFKKKFLSKIDVDLIIWSRIFVISKKIFLSIWSLFPALTPYLSELSEQNILSSESSANQSMLISGSFIISENILEEVKESEVNTEYPNLVYAEFMTIITKHKINNTAGK